MKAFRLITLLAALAILAGCSGSQTPMPQGMGPQAHQSGKSWMLPEASGDDLLYVSDQGHDVYVYDYFSQQQVGQLSVSGSSIGLCTDTAQDVYVSNLDYSKPSIIEYKHGATKPLRTISVPAFPLGCGVNTSTGDLCVATKYGELYVFKKAKGTPKSYSNKHLIVMGACAYASNGNLFIAAGIQGRYQTIPAIAQLAKGSNKIKLVKIRNQLPDYVYDVKPDGAYLALLAGDELLDFSIHGRKATQESHFGLDYIPSWQFYFVPSYGQVIASSDNGVRYYEYPSGFLDRSIDGISNAWGVAVSLAPSHSRTRH